MTHYDIDTSLMYEEINAQGVTQADIVVCLPSLNEASNIAFPTLKASEGLELLKGYSGVVLNCDNNSQDGTKEAFLNTPTSAPKIYLSTPPNIVGKGVNLRNLFNKAAQLNAKAILVLDASLTCVKRSWIPDLIEPIFKQNAALVTPLYVRHKFEAPITNALSYPLLRTLLGRRIRQPISTDLAFSSTMNEIYRSKADLADWPAHDQGFFLNMHMLLEAVIQGAPICQSFVGYPHESFSQMGNFLPEKFAKVLKASFEFMVKHEQVWTKITRTRPTIVAGADKKPQKLPPNPLISAEELYQKFKDLSGPDVQEVWRKNFSRQADIFIKALGDPSFSLPAEIWRDAIYQGSLEFKNADVAHREMIVKSIVPLFFAKTLNYYEKVKDLDTIQAEAMLEGEAQIFEAGKKDLISQWQD